MPLRGSVFRVIKSPFDDTVRRIDVIDALDLYGCIALAVVQSDFCHIVYSILNGRLFMRRSDTHVVYIQIGQYKRAFIHMRQTAVCPYLNDTIVTTKHHGLVRGAYTCPDTEVDILQSLVTCPCGNLPCAFVIAHNAGIRTDKQGPVIGTDDTFQTIVGECTVAFVVFVIVVILLIIDQQPIVMRTDIQCSVGVLMNGVHFETFERQVNPLLLVGVLVEFIQSVLGSHPQSFGVPFCNIVDASEHFCIIHLDASVNVTYIDQLVLTAHPYRMIVSIETHRLDILLRGNQVGLYKMRLLIVFMDDVDTCSIATGQHYSRLGLTQGKEVVVTVCCLIGNGEHRVPLFSLCLI